MSRPSGEFINDDYQVIVADDQEMVDALQSAADLTGTQIEVLSTDTENEVAFAVHAMYRHRYDENQSALSRGPEEEHICTSPDEAKKLAEDAIENGKPIVRLSFSGAPDFIFWITYMQQRFS